MFANRVRKAIVEPLHWETTIQGTPPCRGHKIWSRKNFHAIFVSVTSIEGTPLFRGKGHFFWVSKPVFNLHSGDILTDHKELVDIFNFTLNKIREAFTN